MEIINNKSFIQKIIIAIVIVLSFNFVAPTYSRADTIAEHGGVLLGPVIDLFAGICDSVMVILQVCMSGTDNLDFSINGWMIESNKFDAGTYGMTGSAATTKTINEDDLDHGWLGLDTYNIPVITYSPEAIFANQVPGLEANFINPKFQEDKSIAYNLQETISKWYNTLRNFVLVLLLSVLLYVGIRMVLTSIASDKAKYKQMLMDWLIAVCLLFFLHYIMSFTMTFVDIIAEGVGEQITGVGVSISDGTSFTTNLTGYCRMMIQYKDLGTRLIYLIFYLGLTILTVTFTWKYMKRAITMAFLTLMAPLVTLTYPIDKIGDGKAQAFNMWLKEYIFNALLQPFHLIIYSIFLGGSMEIAVDNPLYAILFLAFISPAEKILRKFFKFDQASTAGAGFAGGFGGAAAFNMMKNLANRGAKGLAQARSGNTGANRDGRIRQQQLTDPNAPDGSMDPFVTGDKTGSANQNEDGVDYTRADRFRELMGQGMSQEEALAQVDQEFAFDRNTGANTSEDDKRGVFAWGRDAAIEKWNNSDLNKKIQENYEKARKAMQESKAAQWTRNMGDRAKSIRDMAKDKYNSMPKPIRNSIERAGQAGIRTIKGAYGVVKGAAPEVARFAGRAAGAAAMGAIGIGMGIAGDDLEDVLTMGAAGAALGWNVGPAVAHNIGSGISSAGSTIRHNYESGSYGADEANLREQDRQFVENQDNRDYFAEQMTKDTGHKPTRSELNKTMQVAAEYNRAGITNVKQINKSMILEKELESELRKSPTSMSEKEITRSARDQAMTIAHIANSVDAKDLRDPKKVEQLQKSFARELMSKDKSMNSNAADAQASRIMGMVMKQKKVY